MDPVQIPIAVPGGNLAALQGLYEVAEEGVNGAKLTQCIDCTTPYAMLVAQVSTVCWSYKSRANLKPFAVMSCAVYDCLSVQGVSTGGDMLDGQVCRVQRATNCCTL